MASSEVSRPGAKYACLGADARRKVVSSIVVSRPDLDAVQGVLEQVRQDQRAAGFARHAIIDGRPGVGKTLACHLFAGKHGSGRDVPVPVVHVTMPVQATPRDVASKILSALGASVPGQSVTTTSSMRLLSAAIARAGTELIVLDDVHNCMDPGNSPMRRRLVPWLMSVVNETPVSLVCVGRVGVEALLTDSEQLSSRFRLRAMLDRFHWSDSDLRAQYLGFLTALDRELPLATASDLDEPELAARLYYATGGVPADLMTIIRQATNRAIVDSSSRLTPSHLSGAFASGLTSTHGEKRDPFSDSGFSIEMADAVDADDCI